MAVSARDVPSAAFATASCFAASAALRSSGSALASSLASTPMARRGTGPRGASGDGVGRDARRGATARARVERALACDVTEGSKGDTEAGDRSAVSHERRRGVAAAERARAGRATRRWFAGSQTQALGERRSGRSPARARGRARGRTVTRGAFAAGRAAWACVVIADIVADVCVRRTSRALVCRAGCG